MFSFFKFCFHLFIIFLCVRFNKNDRSQSKIPIFGSQLTAQHVDTALAPLAQPGPHLQIRHPALSSSSSSARLHPLLLLSLLLLGHLRTVALESLAVMHFGGGQKGWRRVTRRIGGRKLARLADSGG